MGDFQLVIGQVNGTCEAKEDRMKKYLNKVVRLVKKFKEVDFVQISREENMEVDTLAKEASASEVMDEFDEIQYLPNIDFPEVQQIEGEKYWMTPIVSYLKDRKLEGKDEARKSHISQIRPHGQSTIQKGLFTTLSEVFSSGRGQLCTEGGS